jgi:hypothetical protein
MSGGIGHLKGRAIIKVLAPYGGGCTRSHIDRVKHRVVSFDWFYFPAKG